MCMAICIVLDAWTIPGVWWPNVNLLFVPVEGWVSYERIEYLWEGILCVSVCVCVCVYVCVPVCVPVSVCVCWIMRCRKTTMCYELMAFMCWPHIFALQNDLIQQYGLHQHGALYGPNVPWSVLSPPSTPFTPPNGVIQCYCDKLLVRYALLQYIIVHYIWCANITCRPHFTTINKDLQQQDCLACMMLIF